MKKFIALILSSLILCTTVACSPNDSVESSETTEQTTTEQTTTAAIITDTIKENMDNVLAENKFEGIVCLTHNGDVVYQYATGKDESGADLTVESTMYIGSVSKQFCAAAILMLRDQGKLSLDDTLDIYFPEYSLGKDITVKNLLAMRAGISELITGDYDISTDKTKEENISAIKEWIFEQPLYFDPDTSWMYSNSNFFLLSLIVEQVSGQQYNDFIRENFFEPLGMTHSGFVSEVKVSPEWAGGLTYDTFQAREGCEGLTQGAGDIASNAADMDIWMTLLSSGKVISLESYQEMTTDYSPDFAIGQGFGIRCELYADGVGHPGNIGSYTALDYINKENGYNLFVATNTNNLEIEKLPAELLKDLIAE